MCLSKLAVIDCAKIFQWCWDIMDKIHMEKKLKFKERSNVFRQDIAMRAAKKIEKTHNLVNLS